MLELNMKKSMLTIFCSVALQSVHAEQDSGKYIEVQHQKMYVELALSAVEVKHGAKLLCQDVRVEADMDRYIVVIIDCGPGYAEIQNIESASYQVKVIKYGKGEGEVAYVHRME